MRITSDEKERITDGREICLAEFIESCNDAEDTVSEDNGSARQLAEAIEIWKNNKGSISEEERKKYGDDNFIFIEKLEKAKVNNTFEIDGIKVNIDPFDTCLSEKGYSARWHVLISVIALISMAGQGVEGLEDYNIGKINKIFVNNNGSFTVIGENNCKKGTYHEKGMKEFLRKAIFKSS